MIEPECHLWGENFSPKLLNHIADIEMKNFNEPGDIGRRGKYKGKKTPYGSCSIITPKMFVNDRIGWMAKYINNHKEEFKKAGATEIILWIFWYGVQGNMDFTIEQINEISKAKVPLFIDYIFEEVIE